jgi:sugar-phosphatase
LPTANIPNPPQLITANHVNKGKPNPEPYLLGAQKLGLDVKDCEHLRLGGPILC